MRCLAGNVTRRVLAEWGPLERAVSAADSDAFTWMFEVCLADGRRLQAYKHAMTHRYLHLTDTAESFRYCGDSIYAPTPLDDGIAFALGGA